MDNPFDQFDPTEDEAAAALNLAAGAPEGHPVTITSQQRTAAQNAAAKGVQGSEHLTGQAMDFVLPPGVDPNTVRSNLEEAGYPVTEWLDEQAGTHSTGPHIHWGWGQKAGHAVAANPFDQFDGAQPSQSAAAPAGKNPFDQFDAPTASAAPAKGQPEPSWMDVIGAQFRTTFDRWKQQAAGVMQAIGEAPGQEFAVPNVNPLGAGIAQMPERLTPAQKAQDLKDRQAITTWSSQLYANAAQHIREVAPDLPAGSAKAIVGQVVAGTIDMVPLLAAGGTTGNPVIPATLMGASAAAQAYGAARANGRTPEQARMDATFSGFTNGALATVPVGMLMKPGQPFLGKVVKGAASFGAFSVVTEALQIGYDKGLVDPKMTMAQAWDRLVQAGIVGTLQGALLGGGHGAFEAAVNRYHATSPQKPVEPQVEPAAETPAPQANAPVAPRPAPKRADLLAAAAIPEPGPKPAAPAEPAAPQGAAPVAAQEPEPEKPEPFFKPEDLEAPKPKITPASIAQEHAAEVSRIEAEGTQAAEEAHRPEILKQNDTSTWDRKRATDYLEMLGVQFDPSQSLADLRRRAQTELDARAIEAAATPPEPEKPKAPEGLKEIGQNAQGVTLYEDKNGVRSYVENGVRLTEPVALRPVRGGRLEVGGVDRINHPEWATAEELAARKEPTPAEELPTVPAPEPVNEAIPPQPEPERPPAPSLPPPVAPVQPSEPVQHIQLADQVSNHLLSSDKPLTAKDLQAMAERIYGGSLATGTFARDDIYDAAELGLNKLLRSYAGTDPNPYSPATDEERAIARAKAIEDLKNRLPTQTVRAGEKETHQQFSTPPDYAFAAAWAANLAPDDVVLEPSAGTGSFVTQALNAGVREVHANDLSDRRADMLRSLEPTNVTQENAEHIDMLLPETVRPTVVLMNPPFSQTAGRMGTRKVQGIDAQHVEAALDKLQPGGRLVAIFGGGTVTNRGFWKKIAENYDLRASIGVEGGIYRKYGTTFPTRLVVIDKNVPSGREPVKVEGLKTAAEIIRALKDVHDDRVFPAGEQVTPQPVGENLARPGEGPIDAWAPVPDTTGVVGAGEGDRGERPSPAGGGRQPGERAPRGKGKRGGGAAERVPLASEQPERGEPEGAGGHVAGATAEGVEPVGSGGGGAGDGIRPDGSGQRAEPGVTPAPATVRATEISLTAPTDEAPLTDAVYEPYKPQRVMIEGAKEHPGALVQSAAMASVLPPFPKHNLAIPERVIKDGLLSDAQLEAVIYAGHAHAQMIPETPGEGGKSLPERRRGFFIGDGTGVGKGREISGIILDSWERGQRKHIWISEKGGLIKDARRDWSGIGQDVKHIFPHNQVKPADPIRQAEGILFTTYDTLKSAEQVVQQVRDKDGKLVPVKAKGKTRLQQLIDWVGEDFDGVIAFDESHNMANSIDQKGKRGVVKAAAKALAAVDLQNALPKARVVYVSATGATEVSNLGYADRLGLWGRDTAFANRSDFLSKIAKGGVAAMEIVARDMKALGRYIARNLSYEGVTYDRLEHKLTPEQTATYDKLADAWQLVLRNFNAAMEKAGITETNPETGVTKTKNAAAKSAMLAQFWGSHLRFFNQILTGMQMPTVLKAVEKDIADGKQVVLQLVNTNEASQERALNKAKATAEPEALEDLDLSPKDQLMQMVENAYPVNRFEEYVDDNGNVRTRPVLDSEGKPVRDPALIAARDRLLDELGAVQAPEGPLEMLLNHMGSENVAEVTGRKRRVVRVIDPKTGQRRTVEEKRPGSANEAEANMFQAGKKKVLVFSDAGGTGRSYHAENGTPSAGARRSHYLLQAGWRADKAVQGFGRSHRTNQASAPEFHLVTTDLQGQKRFISSIARRLAQLGALTKGERRTGNQGLFGLRDNLESDEAHAALKTFYQDVVGDRVEGVSVADLEHQMGLKILEEGTGRQLQEMPPMTQFLNRLLSLRTDLQNKVFNEFSKRLDDTIDRAAAAGTLDTGVETYRADKISKVSEQTVYTEPETGAETRHVHLITQTRNKPRDYDSTVASLRANNRSRDAFFVRSKRSGKVFGVMDAANFTNKEGAIIPQKRLVGPLGYEFIDERRLDDDMYWETIERPDDQKAAWESQVAKIPEFATEDLHLITGAVLPIWNRLAGSPKIYRLQTDKGERMLGRVIPNDSVNATLEALGAEKLKVKASPDEIGTAVLNEGKQATLANGWKIKRSMVAGEPRLELVGPDFNYMGQLKADGVFTERIDWKTRFFIPTDKAGDVIKKITKSQPVTNLASPAKNEEDAALQAMRAPGFFSAFARAIEAVKMNRAPARDWLGLIDNLRNKGVKQEEIDWSGVRDWLSRQTGPVTKAEVQRVLAENEVQVQEIEKGAMAASDEDRASLQHELRQALPRQDEADRLFDGIVAGRAREIGEAEGLGIPDDVIAPFRDTGGGPTKFGTGQGAPLPGGKNYRELLLTLPPPSWWYEGRRDMPSAAAAAKVFTGGHWEEPNVLAHVRFDDRTGPNGERILHVAEVQSDWHQKGRRSGYKSEGKDRERLDALNAEYQRNLHEINGQALRAIHEGRENTEQELKRHEQLTQRNLDITDEMNAINDKDRYGVPEAPFKQSWPELAMKRMLRYAAENGYDRITWDTGDTNANRYDLSHQVDKIEVFPPGKDHPGELLVQARKRGQLLAQHRMKPEKLADFIGKDAADRALSGGNKKRLDNGESAILTGEDLKVGGEGMRGFYDKILPAFVNRYAKKWGAQVYSDRMVIPPGERNPDETGEPLVHAVDVTPAMRESVMGGQPLFQRGDTAQAPGTTRLAADIVAELPHAPSPQELAVMAEVSRIAREIVPKAEVVAGRRVFSENANRQVGREAISGATTAGGRGIIAWSLESPDAVGTLRHEAVHWLRRNGFLTESEWSTLERAAQTGNWLSRHNIHARYPDLDAEGKIEEAVAEQLGVFRRAPRAVPESVRPIFEKIVRFLGRVADYLRQTFGQDVSANTIFERILAGEIGARTSLPSEGDSITKFQRLDPEERDSAIVSGARALIDVGEDLQMAVAPMARGTNIARATTKDFANLMRTARDYGLQHMRRLKDNFSPAELKRMWEAADEASIAMQQGRTDLSGIGLNRLTDREREAVLEAQGDAQSVWNAMRKAGQIEGDGIPSYVPHLYVEVGETGYKRLGGNRGVRTIPGIGRNLTTTSEHLKHRKYLTAEEGAEAASKKFGVAAEVLKDIRTLPLATMRNRTALAGFQLIKTIKEMGARAGEETVVEGATPPGFFHINHPSFFRWRPKFVRNGETGRVEPALDQNGNTVFEKVPLSVREDWEGPLRAVLTEPEGRVYSAFMQLKMRAMNNIMFSPLVQLHLLTELGRAFPADPWKVLSLKIMFEGYAAKNDPALRLRAVMAGLVPIGHRGAMQDISSITEADNLKPGRSWTSQILAAVPGLFDPRAGDAVKRAVDKMGDVLHNTLLWDRVADLQFGLFTTFSDWARKKGLSPETADRLAAHIANRYAGTLPVEAMSPLARKLSNIFLFSRTYTLGNIGVLKDAITGMIGKGVNLAGRQVGRPDIGKNWGGLPLDIQAQIARDAPEELSKVRSIAARKTLAILAIDVALVYAVNSIAQNVFQHSQGESWDDIWNGYLDRLKAFGVHMQRNPLGILDPFSVMDSLSATAENEIDPATGKPLRRILIGYDKEGTAIYARNPVGKFGEEYANWWEAPLATLKSKLNALAVRPTLDVLANDKGFGRKIYLPTDSVAQTLSKIAEHYIEATLPMDQIDALKNTLTGQQKSTDVMKMIGRTAGITFRRGAPGGPAVGLMYQARDLHEAEVREAMPEIRQMILDGKVEAARAKMKALGIPPKLQLYYVRTTKNPKLRLSPHAMQDFMRYATPEERARMQRLRGAQQ